MKTRHRIKLRHLRTGEELKNVRLRNGMTQEEFASLIGISRQAIQRLERSKSIRPFVGIAIDLLDQLLQKEEEEA